MKRLVLLVFVLCMMFSTTVTAEEEYHWIEGGQTVDLGDIAAIDLDPDFIFLDRENTQKLSMSYGDMVTGLEIGSIFPMDENETWAVYFEYEESGHIKDAENEKIDAKALLKSYQEGMEEVNEARDPGDYLYVTGWDIEPFYNEESNNLTWSILLEDENKESYLNYHTRILTRVGYLSITLVTDPQNIEADKKMFNEKIMSNFSVKEGNRYADFDKSTDEVAENGLAELILGEVGLTIAQKAGLLAIILTLGKKFGVFIIAGIVALWGFMKKMKKNNQSVESDEVINQ